MDHSSKIAEAERDFMEYFCRNYPGPDTVIFDPKWHAPKLFRAATHKLLETLSIAGEGKVKALEWDSFGQATTVLGEYNIVCIGQCGVFGLILPGQGESTLPYGREGSEAECREAAQADFEALVLSCLNPSAATNDTSTLPIAVAGRWLPIAQADRTITDVQDFSEVGITLRNSDRYWVRDTDGRVYEASWTDDKDGYWWDWEAESPVDPIEFMPHPLDPRFSALVSSPGKDGGQEVEAEPTGYCVWINGKLAGCAKSHSGSFPVYASTQPASTALVEPTSFVLTQELVDSARSLSEARPITMDHCWRLYRALASAQSTSREDESR
ncbi:hypothetical protein BTE77_27855 [Ensifer adhaerens]|nr:hypothetical protein BTE77_27855 [Ensifer adhaerens]